MAAVVWLLLIGGWISTVHLVGVCGMCGVIAPFLISYFTAAVVWSPPFPWSFLVVAGGLLLVAVRWSLL